MSYNFLFYYNNHTIHLHIGPILMHAFINIHEYSQKLTFFLLANLMGGILDFKIHIVILFPPCSISKKTVLKFIKCPNLCFESQTRNIYNYSFIAITIIGILLFIWKLPVLEQRAHKVTMAIESACRENAHAGIRQERFFQTCS